MQDTSHLSAIIDRLDRERTRLAAAGTAKERAFRTTQVSQAEKELASEMRFLDIAAAPQTDMTDDELLAALS